MLGLVSGTREEVHESWTWMMGRTGQADGE